VKINLSLSHYSFNPSIHHPNVEIEDGSIDSSEEVKEEDNAHSDINMEGFDLDGQLNDSDESDELSDHATDQNNIIDLADRVNAISSHSEEGNEHLKRREHRINKRQEQFRKHKEQDLRKHKKNRKNYVMID
jgi:hypothetical protein